MSASVPGANAAASVCRAIMLPGTLDAVSGIDVTFADGSVATVSMVANKIYPFAATETNSATVIFLY
jgi:hypothetical protein